MIFSQRIGKTSIRELIQIESIDKALENRLWNIIISDFFGKISNAAGYYESSDRDKICSIIWTEFFNEKIDEAPSYSNGGVASSLIIDFIKKWFLKANWYKKYDLVEFLSSINTTLIRLDTRLIRLEFIENCNKALKKESAGYRIINEKIVQITSEEEVVAIEEALINSSIWAPVNTHLKTALGYLSNRENPDYRNSIKESISAVESLCVIITGYKDATLGKALSLIDKKITLHGALKNAFSSLYGYSSDSGGIRHALLEDDFPVTMEDAKFILVSCSAFINYLKIKIEK
jgi:hypothetical protein